MNQKLGTSESILFTEAIDKAASESKNAFHSFFDSNEALDRTAFRGHWDFSVHLITRTVSRYMPFPEDKVALEVGY